MRRKALVGAACVIAFFAVAAPPADAIHFYRGPGGGCTPAEGALTDGGALPPYVAAEVMVLHNTFNDAATGLPVTVIDAGESIRWTWNSSHCHSVGTDGEAFTSGFHYPTTPPESPQVVPGFFEYPVPDDTPTLTYTRTFTTPGTYLYSCVHHAVIGMRGAVVVQ